MATTLNISSNSMKSLLYAFLVIIVLSVIIACLVYYFKPSTKHAQAAESFTSSPTTTASYGVINYINDTTNIADIHNIGTVATIDTPDIIDQAAACTLVKDDNTTLMNATLNKDIGINATATPQTCQTVYSAYVNNNLDINKPLITTADGVATSLAQLCPETCQTPQFQQCNQLLLSKYNTTDQIASDIADRVQGIVVSQLTDRTSTLGKLEKNLTIDKAQPNIANYYAYEATNYPISSETSDFAILDRAHNYYASKGETGIETFSAGGNVLNSQQSQLLIGNYSMLDGTYELMRGMSVIIDGVSLLFVNEYGRAVVKYTFDNAADIDVVNSSGQLTPVTMVTPDKYGVALRIIKVTNMTTSTFDDENTVQIINLLATLGIMANTFIYITVDNGVVDPKTKRQYYSVLNSGRTTILQLLRN